MTELMLPTQTLVALTPGDVAPAQANLEQWCRAKVVSLGKELREARQNLRMAKQFHWRRSGWQNAINRLKARMVYYAKIKAAVSEGYLIVPNFDIDVFAVRTQRRMPLQKDDYIKAQPDLSPPGQGRYVDDELFSVMVERSRVNKDNTVSKWKVEWPEGFDEAVDLPLRGVKPIILDATQRAMALRIFDQIGVVKARKQDPIIVGQIIDPSNNGYHWKKSVSFFIAWWLDPETL